MKRTEFSSAEHTFSVCAYKESSYLEKCIQSLIEQSVKSKVIICTSTPNNAIIMLAKKYNLELYVNTKGSGIAIDWNYAYSMSRTKLVTICHQDDIYHKEYLKQILSCLSKARKPLIAFSDYSEIRDEKIVHSNKNLRIKRILITPIRIFNSVRYVKRLILAFGNPICCPSVTFVKEALPTTIFQDTFRSNLDWNAWDMISHFKGAFVYCPKRIVSHRIHKDSETTNVLNENIRIKEDYAMFRKYWGSKNATILTRLYATSEKSNETK